MLPVTKVPQDRVEIAGLRDLRAVPRRRGLRAVLAALAGLLLLVTALAVLAGRAPESLADARLVGPRSPAPLDVVVLLDESSSFRDYAPIREALLRQLAVWAPENLRPDDSITVVSFAGDAAIRLAPTRVADLADPAYLAVTLDGSSTAIQPALSVALAADLDHASTLVMVTDTEVTDATPTDVDALVRGLDAVSATTIVPTGVGVQGDWRDVFGWGLVLEADPASAGEVGVAIAEALAHATGQDVEKVR